MNFQKHLIFSLLFVSVFSLASFSQKNGYTDSLQQFIENYIQTHEVVKDGDRKNLRFFPINKKYRIECRFERTENSPWLMMETSGPIKKSYRVYGKINFTLNDTAVSMNIYQSQNLMGNPVYKNYLFIPFMDATTGEETYESGRYLDLLIENISDNRITVDFNKAYNPYCAYIADVYNCPVPPRENWLKIAVPAGEKKYLKQGQ